MTPPAAPFGEVDALFEKATKGPWYLLEAPWLPRDCETTILAGSPDPHAGLFVCDFENFGEDGDAPRNGWNDAELIVALVNAYPALKAANAAAATAARNDALEEAARVLDTTFPDDWSEWAAAKIRALAAQGKG